MKELEAGLGYVTLQDGSKFRPMHSGISLLREALKLEESLGRPPKLEDFSASDQEQIKSYAKWDSDGKHGALVDMVSQIAREILDRSTLD